MLASCTQKSSALNLWAILSRLVCGNPPTRFFLSPLISIGGSIDCPILSFALATCGFFPSCKPLIRSSRREQRLATVGLMRNCLAAPSAYLKNLYFDPSLYVEPHFLRNKSARIICCWDGFSYALATGVASLRSRVCRAARRKALILAGKRENLKLLYCAVSLSLFRATLPNTVSPSTISVTSRRSCCRRPRNSRDIPPRDRQSRSKMRLA